MSAEQLFNRWVKWTLTLFALVFVGVRPLEPVALFVGYVLVLGTSASALLLMKNNPKH